MSESLVPQTPPPPANRGRPTRFVVALAFFAVVTLAALYFGVPLGKQFYAQYHRLAWQRRCMSYAPPASTVVYEEDPDRAAALEGRDGYFDLTPAAVAGEAPPGWRAEGFVPGFWDAGFERWAGGQSAGLPARPPQPRRPRAAGGRPR